MASWRDRKTELALLGGGALTAVYYAVPDGAAKNSIYGLVGFLAVVAIVWCARDSVPWLLFAAGNLLFSIGDDVGAGFWNGNPPVPSAADAFYLAGYPVLATGLMLLLFKTGAHRRTAALADATIVTFAFLLVQWVYLLDEILGSSDSTFTIAVNAAYPLMDLVLLAGLAGFFVTAAWRTPAFWLLAVSVALLLGADEVFALGSYTSGGWTDTGYLLSYTLWAAAALHPSRRELSQPSRRRHQRLRISAYRVGTLMVALLAPPAVLLIQHLRHAPLHAWAIASTAAVISVFVVLRLTGILRALEGIRVRERAARADAEQAQRLLEAQNERLVEADRLKDEFVALISHDLRTPLTSIMGYVELSLDEPLADDTRSYLEVVARSSQRLLRLVDDLLFVARLQSGRLEIMPSRLDLNEVARQAA